MLWGLGFSFLMPVSRELGKSKRAVKAEVIKFAVVLGSSLSAVGSTQLTMFQG